MLVDRSIDWTDQSIASSIRLRQRPGPDNALGLVKFIFPNNFSIYLHDTPGWGRTGARRSPTIRTASTGRRRH